MRVECKWYSNIISILNSITKWLADTDGKNQLYILDDLTLTEFPTSFYGPLSGKIKAD